jgi:spore coat protein CotH
MPGPGANFSYAGDDPTQYKKGFEAKNKAAEKSFDELIDIIKKIDKDGKSNYEQMLSENLRLEHFLKITARKEHYGSYL